MKRAEFINIKYLIDHAEDIINNTEVIFPYWQWLATRNPVDDSAILRDIWKRIEKKTA